jgi:hypothetical protein
MIYRRWFIIIYTCYNKFKSYTNIILRISVYRQLVSFRAEEPIYFARIINRVFSVYLQNKERKYAD